MNNQDVLDVISMEVQSCTKIQKFEFFQKLCILDLWVGLINKTAPKTETYTTYKSQFNERHFEADYQNYLDSGSPGSNFHLNMLCLMASTQVCEVVEKYRDKALIVEALCLCKAFGTDKLYLDTLKKLQATLFSSKDKRGQYDKLSAAIT